MERLLGDQAPAFLDSYAAPPHAGLRVNTLKLSSQAFQSFSPYALQPLPWTACGFLLETDSTSPPPGKHPYHAAGLYYLQEPSAMAVVEALAPQPGEKVLDLAAAPGGKTTHLASCMQGRGLLIANEIHPRRVWDLAENLERWGATQVVITNETPERLAAQWDSYFDRVLLDAPCSGEGLFRKTPASQIEWSEALVQSCAVRQSTILDQAARMVRPGGWLAYSTCTFAPQENEAVITRFLKDCQAGQDLDYQLVSLAHIPGLDPGRPDWLDPSLLPLSAFHGEYTARIWPHRSPGEGHFIALLQRVDTGSAPFPPQRSSRQQTNPDLDAARRLYGAFCRDALLSELISEKLSLVGSYLYDQPTPLPRLQGMKVIHPGLWLGTVKKDRFEPSHALALALRATQARRTLVLDPASSPCMSYLRGETLPASTVEGEGNGWTLVCLTTPDRTHRYPLGWVRRTGDQLKNAYPKGLRRAS